MHVSEEFIVCLREFRLPGRSTIQSLASIAALNSGSMAQCPSGTITPRDGFMSPMCMCVDTQRLKLLTHNELSHQRWAQL